MARTYNEALKTFRSIGHLLRHQNPNGKISSMAIVNEMKEQIRRHDLTAERTCRAPNELQFIAQCYRDYLESGQRYREIYSKYFGKGEKTTEQAANIVGLKLPKLPNLSNDS